MIKVWEELPYEVPPNAARCLFFSVDCPAVEHPLGDVRPGIVASRWEENQFQPLGQPVKGPVAGDAHGGSGVALPKIEVFPVLGGQDDAGAALADGFLNQLFPQGAAPRNYPIDPYVKDQRRSQKQAGQSGGQGVPGEVV